METADWVTGILAALALAVSALTFGYNWNKDRLRVAVNFSTVAGQELGVVVTNIARRPVYLTFAGFAGPRSGGGALVGFVDIRMDDEVATTSLQPGEPKEYPSLRRQPAPAHRRR